MSNPFTYVEAISYSKQDIFNEDSEKEYVPYLINNALSYFPDTIHYANDMNMLSHIPKKQQFQYLLNSIRPRKRFSKWSKPVENEIVAAIQHVYQYNVRNATDALSILTEEQKQNIRELSKGDKK